MSEDPRLSAARYRVARLDGARVRGGGGGPHPADEVAGGAHPDPQDAAAPRTPDTTRTPTAVDRSSAVEVAIQQAMRRGEFDDLPGSGKPIPGLGDRHDPDWWIRRKIETERLTGLGPDALRLRVEDRALADTLDELTREDEVRESLADFNRRVRLARMQLQGGPPVVTAPRDIDDEVRAWRERRDSRSRARLRVEESVSAPRRRWWRRAPR